MDITVDALLLCKIVTINILHIPLYNNVSRSLWLLISLADLFDAWLCADPVRSFWFSSCCDAGLSSSGVWALDVLFLDSSIFSDLGVFDSWFSGESSSTSPSVISWYVALLMVLSFVGAEVRELIYTENDIKKGSFLKWNNDF